MQRYQPPHLRRQAAPAPALSPVGSGTGSVRVVSAEAGPSIPRNHATQHRTPQASQTAEPAESKGQHHNVPRPSRKDWSAPTGGPRVLASPAGDIRPMRAGAGAKVVVGEMELMQSISRSGGDGAEGDALKDWTTQERYRQYIDERIDAHYTTFTTARHTLPKSRTGEEIESLGSIVLLLRKLREGVIASHRIDGFAIEVFESSARYSILAHNRPQLISALSGLVPGLYVALDSKRKIAKGKAGATDLADDLAGLSVVDQSGGDKSGKAEFASLLLLYNLVTSGPRAFHDAFTELTCPRRKTLQTPFTSTPTTSTPTPTPAAHTDQPFITSSALRFALKAYSALSEETFDPISYFTLLHGQIDLNGTVTGTGAGTGTTYERAILSWAEDKVRDRAWELLRKSYLSADESWAGRMLGLASESHGESVLGTVQEWAQARGAKWQDGAVKLR